MMAGDAGRRAPGQHSRVTTSRRTFYPLGRTVNAAPWTPRYRRMAPFDWEAPPGIGIFEFGAEARAGRTLPAALAGVERFQAERWDCFVARGGQGSVY